MKIITFLLISIFLILPLPANASDPVLEINCQPGGEYGNVINLKLSKDSHYGTLTIKRKNANTDHSRDLSGFTGGIYKLDLSTRGGITGYTIEYAAKDSTEMVTAEGSINCSAPDTIPTDVSEPPTVPPPPAPEPESEGTSPSAPEPKPEETPPSAPEPKPEETPPSAPELKPEETPPAAPEPNTGDTSTPEEPQPAAN